MKYGLIGGAKRLMSAKVLGVIPARWASERFPGKLLHPLHGKPVLQWVIERVQQVNALSEVILAVDDKRIQSLGESLGVRTVMTDPDLASGTDRVAAVLQETDAESIINIQGDEPLIDVATVQAMAEALKTGEPMVTAAAPIEGLRDLIEPSVVKVVLDENDYALYFSRSVIPHPRDQEMRVALEENSYLRHIGIYGYQREVLESFVSWPQGSLEQIEKLEQLRALQNGVRIKVLKQVNAYRV